MPTMEHVEPFLHPHSSIPIDLDRLEQINLSTSHPRHRGRTTAFVVHLVGCAQVAEPGTSWLYITDNQQANDYARRMFTDILTYEPGSPILTVTNTRVTINTGGAPAEIDFRPLPLLDPFIRGRILQDYFLDVEDDSLRRYNDNNPGILTSLQSRIEIEPC